MENENHNLGRTYVLQSLLSCTWHCISYATLSPSFSTYESLVFLFVGMDMSCGLKQPHQDRNISLRSRSLVIMPCIFKQISIPFGRSWAVGHPFSYTGGTQSHAHAGHVWRSIWYCCIHVDSLLNISVDENMPTDLLKVCNVGMICQKSRTIVFIARPRFLRRLSSTSTSTSCFMCRCRVVLI